MLESLRKAKEFSRKLENEMLSNIIDRMERLLSMLFTWRATMRESLHFFARKNFYPRSPYGERLDGLPKQTVFVIISTHALRMESDGQSLRQAQSLQISIHALHTESDSKSTQKFPALLHKKHTSYPFFIIDPQTLSKLPINPKVFSILFITIPVRTSQAFYARYSFAQTK